MNKIRISELFGIFKECWSGEEKLDKEIKDYFKRKSILLNKGRSAIRLAIEDFELQNSEVIIPSFICSDIFAAIFKEYNITPRIVDCEEGRLTISAVEAEKLINEKTKAIIIVHPLGVPCHPEDFRKLCEKHKLVLIEDCAHCISLKYKGKYLGEYGDGAIFSFAKEMPNFAGGVYINNRREVNKELLNKIKKYRLTRSDLMFLASKFNIYRFLLRFRRSSGKINSEIGNVEEIMDMPKIAKAIFSYYSKKIDFSGKRKMAQYFYLTAKKKGVIMPLGLRDIMEFSDKSMPVIVKSREKVLKSLFDAGINPGIGWNPSFSLNEGAKKLWNLPETKNAEFYSKNMIAISIEELNKENIDKIIDIVASE